MQKEEGLQWEDGWFYVGIGILTKVDLFKEDNSYFKILEEHFLDVFKEKRCRLEVLNIGQFWADIWCNFVSYLWTQ